MKKIVALFVTVCMLLLCSCGDGSDQSSQKSSLCEKNGHSGCFVCEVCGESFLDDFKVFVDKNKADQGFIPITGSNYYGAIQYNDDFAIVVTITQEVISGVASQSFSLAYKKGYSSSKWIYYYEMSGKTAGNKTMIGGEFKTIEDGEYLPYNTYSGSNLSLMREVSYDMYKIAVDSLSKSFKDFSSGLIVQYFGLNI